MRRALRRTAALPVVFILLAGGACVTDAGIGVTYGQDRQTGQLSTAEASVPMDQEREHIVLVVDQTWNRWHGLTSVMAAWSSSPIVDVLPAFHCRQEYYCIRIPEPREYQDSDWLGLWVNSDPAYSTVFLDSETSYADDETYRRKIVSHEIGHALGLVHNDSPISVMGPEPVPLPTAYDMRLLADADAFPPRGATAYWQ